MEFGKPEIGQLERTDFTLPPEPSFNAATFKMVKKGNQPVYVGCAKWGRKEWIGKIYPKGIKEKDFLAEYGKHYNSIELNATNYKFYKKEDLAGWAGQMTNPQFKFCPKAHKGLNFLATSEQKGRLSDDFIVSLTGFGEMLGPVFFLIDQRHDPVKLEQFFTYLRSLPKDISFFVGMRNADFYANKVLTTSFFETLREIGIGSVITDVLGRSDVLHMHLSIPKAFIRFVGNSLHPSDYKRIDNWVDKIKFWLGKGIEEIYFFMHMHDEATSPELSRYLVDQLNKKCSLGFKEVQFVT
ncbi:MAG: DUF72 domain-containing protein [Chitinophagaceae bacterium]